ncbi:MAG TPA: hypothetical protein VG276_27770 [Actinomycetes bacterium]|jgi:hypothetical protein|nr:hypothetical protein [Actinomycetes bacterium]
MATRQSQINTTPLFPEKASHRRLLRHAILVLALAAAGGAIGLTRTLGGWLVIGLGWLVVTILGSYHANGGLRALLRALSEYALVVIIATVVTLTVAQPHPQQPADAKPKPAAAAPAPAQALDLADLTRPIQTWLTHLRDQANAWVKQHSPTTSPPTTTTRRR